MPIVPASCLFLHGSCRHVNIADMTTNARSETGSESHTGYATGLFRSCLHALKLNGSMTGRTPVDMLASQANRVPAENRRISICRYRSGDGSYPRWLIPCMKSTPHYATMNRTPFPHWTHCVHVIRENGNQMIIPSSLLNGQPIIHIT